MNRSIEQVRNVIERAWNAGDLDMLDTAVTPSCIRFVPGNTLHGPEGFKQHIAAVRAAFPDFHSRIDDITARGARGVVSWTASGTHRGGLMGLPPSMKRVEWSGLTVFETMGGLLSREWELFDFQNLLAQLVPDSVAPSASGR